MQNLIQFLNDHNAAVTQLFAYAIATFVFISRNRYCDGQHAALGNRLDALENTTSPAVDEVVQLYNTAERTLEAVRKMYARQGRGMQAQAQSILNALDAAPSETPAPAKKLVGGVTTGGGLITTKRP